MSLLISVIGLAIRAALSLIPAAIAKKKYYSEAGFFVYGFFAFLPALIHAICLPDQSNVYARKVSSSMVASGAAFGIVSAIGLAMRFVGIVDSYGRFSTASLENIVAVAGIWLEIGLAILLIICVYRCNRGRGLMTATVFLGVVALLAPVFRKAVYWLSFYMRFSSSSYLKESMKYLAIELIPELVAASGVFVGSLILVLFITDMRKGRYMIPRRLYWFVPTVLAIVTTVIAPVFGRFEGVPAMIGYIITLFTLGLYCLLASDIPFDATVGGEQYQ